MKQWPILLILATVAGLVFFALLSVRRQEMVKPGGSIPRHRAGQNLDTWILEGVRFYHSLGFLNQYEGQEISAITSDIKRRLIENWGDQLSSTDSASELFLIELMPARVWWQDTEADVLMGNDVYVQVLGEWGAISEGIFKPEDIVEHWESEEGPLRITFTLEGQPRELHPEVNDDWLDLGILQEINRMIAASGREFVLNVPDQTAVVMCITPEEQQRLETERGWTFIPAASASN